MLHRIELFCDRNFEFIVKGMMLFVLFFVVVIGLLSTICSTDYVGLTEPQRTPMGQKYEVGEYYEGKVDLSNFGNSTTFPRDLFVGYPRPLSHFKLVKVGEKVMTIYLVNTSREYIIRREGFEIAMDLKYLKLFGSKK